MTLEELFIKLDRYQHRVPLNELTSAMEQLEIEYEDVEHCAQFDDERYRRNLLRAGNGYHALILCWRNGQRSPIHDHRGSSCGVKVLRGQLTETIFERTANGFIIPSRNGELSEGDTCGSQDSDIHQISNISPDGEDLVTLHIYSPPLLVMNTYSLESNKIGEFADPIFEFCYGDGI